MKYTKSPLDFEAQADRLLGRGLVADRDLLIRRLQSVSYYRSYQAIYIPTASRNPTILSTGSNSI